MDDFFGFLEAAEINEVHTASALPTGKARKCSDLALSVFVEGLGFGFAREHNVEYVVGRCDHARLRFSFLN